MRIKGLHSDQNCQLLSLGAFSQKIMAKRYIKVSDLKTFGLIFFERNKYAARIGESPLLWSCDHFLSTKTFDYLTNAETHESIRFANFLALKQKWNKRWQSYKENILLYTASQKKRK